MSQILSNMKAVLGDLKRFGLSFTLIGGFAVSLRTRPRTTKDIDFSIAVENDGQAEDVVRKFITSGYRNGAVLEHEATGRLATVRFYLPDSESSEPDLDLMFCSCGIENEIVAGSSTINMPNVGKLPVARTGHLIAMKVLSQNDQRETDRADLRNLFAVASSVDLEIAEKSIELIIERGFHRDKDLKRDYRFFAASAEG